MLLCQIKHGLKINIQLWFFFFFQLKSNCLKKQKKAHCNSTTNSEPRTSKRLGNAPPISNPNLQKILNHNSFSFPFCIDNEYECTPGIFRLSSDPNWKLWVIDNLHPALSRNLEYPVGQNGDSSNELGGGVGSYPYVLTAYKRRIEQIKGFV